MPAQRIAGTHLAGKMSQDSQPSQFAPVKKRRITAKKGTRSSCVTGLSYDRALNIVFAESLRNSCLPMRINAN